MDASSCTAFNIATLTAVAGILAAIGALAGAWAIFRQTRLTTKVQVLMQLLSKWESSGMQLNRAYAGGCILNQQPLSPWVDDILDFFETVAMFWKRKILDDEIVLKTFYHDMAGYWCKTESYIRAAQKDEGSEIWKDYCDLMRVLIKREGEEFPGAEEVKQFIINESKRRDMMR